MPTRRTARTDGPPDGDGPTRDNLRTAGGPTHRTRDKLRGDKLRGIGSKTQTTAAPPRGRRRRRRWTRTPCRPDARARTRTPCAGPSRRPQPPPHGDKPNLGTTEADGPYRDEELTHLGPTRGLTSAAPPAGPGPRTTAGTRSPTRPFASGMQARSTVCSQLRPLVSDGGWLTTPRQVLPGSTYLVTRRCAQRQFLLKPSPRTNQLIRYCLADAARHTGVLLHAVCFMSNHWHGVVTDPQARLPEFLERFHRLLARAQNASLGRWENLWSSDKPSVVALVSDEDVLEKMAYTIANPVAAGLVRSPREWPGVVSLQFSERTIVRRPDIFFDSRGRMPENVTLEIVRPPIHAQLDDVTLAVRAARVVERRLREARQALHEAGREVLGAKAVLQQSVDTVPQSREVRRNPNPRIAARHTPERVQAIRRLLDFIRRYRAAWHAWRAGARETTFPQGTYALRIYARVACAPACPG
jgi:putative transposase